MPYKNFSTRAEALSRSPAIHHVRMRVLIHEMSVKNFSIVADRVAMKDQLSNIETHFDLFDKTHRFPDNGLYVFLDLEDWNKKWQDLNSALDFKSGDKDAKKFPKSQLHNNNSGGPSFEETPQWDFNDASQVFRNTLRIMSNQLISLEGVLNRESFENGYHIPWVENESTGAFFSSEQFKFRPRSLLIDPLNIGNPAWPGIANMNVVSDLPDTLIDVDYIYVWGLRSNTDRPRIVIDTETFRIDEIRSIVTAD